MTKGVMRHSQPEYSDRKNKRINILADQKVNMVI